MKGQHSSPPYGWAAGVTIGIFGIYLATLAPTTAFWDTSEYIAAAAVLGIPHPPGNPLFTLTAHVFGLLPLATTYAVRINLFAAVTSAAAAGLWFLVADRWLREIVPVRWARLAAAAGGTLVAATSWTVWNQSTVNEKVYTLSLFSMALVTWLAVHWGDDTPGPHRNRWLVLIAYILALSSTNHMMGVLAVPALVVYVVWTDWRAATEPWVVLMAFALALAITGQWTTVVGQPLSEWGTLVWVTPVVIGYALWRAPGDFKRPLLYVGIAAVIIGVSLNYIYLPIRAGQFPPINEGEPTSWSSLLDVLNREQYAKPSVFLRQADFAAQLVNYGQYLSWQFARDWGWFARVATVVFSLLGLGGLVSLLRRDRRAGLAAAAMFGTLTLALIFYLNFKYGFSVYPDRADLVREVRERDYFFVGSFAYFGVLVALGFGAAFRGIAEFLSLRLDERTRWLAASPILILAFIPLFGNRLTASRAHETLPRDVAIDMLESVEPYGILVTAGDNDTFPLWYAQEVEGVRRDVTLANLSLMNTEWHLRQLRRRAEPPFESERSIALWQGQTWPRPDGPVFTMSEQELDSLPLLFPVQLGQVLQFDRLRLEFGTDLLEKRDLAMLALIRDNLGKRPIFFSWSSAGYPDQTFTLTPYLVTQGLARKLMPSRVVAHDSVVWSQGLGFMDLARTRELLWNAYHYESAGRERPRGWMDPPSGTILQLYLAVYSGYAATLRQLGEENELEAARADSVAAAVRREIGVPEFLSPTAPATNN
jgi:hypothetical protein